MWFYLLRFKAAMDPDGDPEVNPGVGSDERSMKQNAE